MKSQGESLKKDTREILLDSAYETFYQYGYQGANIASILKEVGINKGSMYYFFKSKKALGLAVADERIRRNLNAKYHSLLQETDSYLALFNTLESAPDSLKYGCPLNKMSQEMLYIDDDFKKMLSSVYDDFETAVENIITKSVEEGVIPACDAKAAARLIIASYEGALMIYHLNRDRVQYADILQTLKKQFM